MKKIAAIILVISLLLSAFPISCLAEEAHTSCRELIEYVELYTRRITELRAVLGYDEIPSTFTDGFFAEMNQILFSFEAGMIYANPETYKVESVSIAVKQDTESSSDNSLKCLCAVSALEYDGTQENVFSILGESVLSKSIDTMTEITGKLTSAITESKQSGERVLVYSGNYEYYVECIEYKDRELINLIAQSR